MKIKWRNKKQKGCAIAFLCAVLFFAVFSIGGSIYLRCYRDREQGLYYEEAPHLYGLDFFDTVERYSQIGYECDITVTKYIQFTDCSHIDEEYPAIWVWSKLNGAVYKISLYFTEEAVKNRNHSIEKLIELGKIGLDTADQVYFEDWLAMNISLREPAAEVINDTWYELTFSVNAIHLKIGY